MQAIRDNLKNANRNRGTHAGLLLRRFLHVSVKAEGKKHSSDRAELYDAAKRASQAARPVYEAAFARWKSDLLKDTAASTQGQEENKKTQASLLKNAVTVAATLSTSGRLIVGLGGDNVLETGLTLHHTYGVPIIPGSALKGLAAHYCDTVWGARLETDPARLTDDNHRYRRLRPGERRGHNGIHPETGQYHEILFGTTDDSGHIVFHDAWITSDSLWHDAPRRGPSGLLLDVLTPHHSDYYSDQSGTIAPTDFDDPKPVTFLSVSGRFLVAVSCDVPGDAGKAWAELAFELLQEALRDWGVGGKTSSGYGRLASIELSGTPGKLQTHIAMAKPKEPVHGRREKVKVIQRTVDGKLRYEADDGFLGSLLKGTPPDLKDGESTDLWIVRVDKHNKKVPYVFQTDEPPESESPQNRSQGSDRNRQRPGEHRR